MLRNTARRMPQVLTLFGYSNSWMNWHNRQNLSPTRSHNLFSLHHKETHGDSFLSTFDTPFCLEKPKYSSYPNDKVKKLLIYVFFNFLKQFHQLPTFAINHCTINLFKQYIYLAIQ